MSNIPEEFGSSTDVEVDAARKYHALMELGRGGTALVSAGIARGIGGFTKLVVLKTIKPEFLADRDMLRMFIDEARLSARMNHPNVVQVYEVFRQNRLPVIVMEYLDGQSLARLQARAFHDPNYTTPMAIAILCKVLAGLEYAHSLADYDGTPLELVHRDVSPQNVMLTYDGQVKLVDFGIAKLRARTGDTQTGVVKGKIAYMAPEQLQRGRLDRRGDLFAVGVMLWEVIARRRMWRGRSDADIMRSLLLDAVPSLQAAAPGADPELCQICNTALAVRPEARYASAAEFQTELERYLERRAISIRQEDIAGLITRVCADVRADASERLKVELAKFAAGAPGWEDALTAFDQLRTPTPPRRSRGSWPLLVMSAIVVFASVLLAIRWLLGPERAAPEAAAVAAVAVPVAVPPTAAPTPGPAVHPQAPTQVVLRVTLSPPEALLSLDARSLGRTPLSLSLPLDDRPHQLRAEAPGYEPLLQELRLDRDQELELSLSPAPAPAAPPRRRARSSRSRAAKAHAKAARAPLTAPKVDCDPPYYVGLDGVKHYRPECL